MAIQSRRAKTSQGCKQRDILYVKFNAARIEMSLVSHRKTLKVSQPHFFINVRSHMQHQWHSRGALINSEIEQHTISMSQRSIDLNQNRGSHHIYLQQLPLIEYIGSWDFHSTRILWKIFNQSQIHVRVSKGTSLIFGTRSREFTIRSQTIRLLAAAGLRNHLKDIGYIPPIYY
jgi:hypothetical protein